MQATYAQLEAYVNVNPAMKKDTSGKDAREVIEGLVELVNENPTGESQDSKAFIKYQNNFKVMNVWTKLQKALKDGLTFPSAQPEAVIAPTPAKKAVISEPVAESRVATNAIAVQVRTLAGKSLSLSIDPMQTIMDLQLKDGLTFPSAQPEAVIAPTPAKKAVISEPVAESRVATNAIAVQVRTLAGKSLSLRIDPMQTILDLKLKVEEQDGIPAQKQTLCYGRMELEPLDDDKALQDLRLPEGAVIFSRRRHHAAWGQYKNTLEVANALSAASEAYAIQGF